MYGSAPADVALVWMNALSSVNLTKHDRIFVHRRPKKPKPRNPGLGIGLNPAFGLEKVPVQGNPNHILGFALT